VAYILLTGELKKELMNAQLPEGYPVRDFPGLIFYVKKNNGGDLEDVTIYRLQNETNVDTTIHAVRGKLESNRAENQLVLQLFEVRSATIGPHGNTISSSPTMNLNFSAEAVTNRPFEPKISDMTFGQLRNKLHDLEGLNLAPAATNSPAEWRAQLATLRQQQKDFAEPVRVEMHRQVAFSFACFGFTLVGIPLGIRVHRRETNIGVALALVLVVVYYAFVMLGESLSSRPELYPHLILWLPNFIFQAVGAVLLWRANRGI
jgi:lipopolysaccharide export system permease protein